MNVYTYHAINARKTSSRLVWISGSSEPNAKASIDDFFPRVLEVTAKPRQITLKISLGTTTLATGYGLLKNNRSIQIKIENKHETKTITSEEGMKKGQITYIST